MRVMGMFVTEPETRHSVYHLSPDDKVVLCGRNIRRMVCVGERDEDDLRLMVEISTSYTLMWRCCWQCKAALKRNKHET